MELDEFGGTRWFSERLLVDRMPIDGSARTTGLIDNDGRGVALPDEAEFEACELNGSCAVEALETDAPRLKVLEGREVALGGSGSGRCPDASM